MGFQKLGNGCLEDVFSICMHCIDHWRRVYPEVTIHGNVAYVAQQAWVMNASVKENILFGHRYDPLFYDKTVKACALLEDFAQLPDGDETEVGERGISLSGGQKARLTLARAVYVKCRTITSKYRLLKMRLRLPNAPISSLSLAIYRTRRC